MGGCVPSSPELWDGRQGDMFFLQGHPCPAHLPPLGTLGTAKLIPRLGPTTQGAARLLPGLWAPLAGSDLTVPVKLGQPEPCLTPSLSSRSPWRADPGRGRWPRVCGPGLTPGPPCTPAGGPVTTPRAEQEGA